MLFLLEQQNSLPKQHDQEGDLLIFIAFNLKCDILRKDKIKLMTERAYKDAIGQILVAFCYFKASRYYRHLELARTHQNLGITTCRGNA